MEEQLRSLPSVDELAGRLSGVRLPHEWKVRIARGVIESARKRIRAGLEAGDLEGAAQAEAARMLRPSLRRVINATGVILHTNLGRAPLAEATGWEGYSNLEYDLATGARGKRDVHVAEWIERLAGKPGIAVNNNAAAVYLVLNELAAGGEVVVSRGELIEIGDGFRIPDIMARAGVTLREVGTTNRTRAADYRAAINERTRLLLRVHPSNFRMEGFTEAPELRELAALGRERGIPLYEDLGSGCVVDLSPFGVREPLVKDSIAAGVDVVSFSGDKLLGGPQAGVIAGDGELVARIRRNPMFRALRLDKVMVAHLAGTLRMLALGEWDAVPALRMIRLGVEDIRARAEALQRALPHRGAVVIEGESRIGGGSTPAQSLPTVLLALGGDVVELERKLRGGDPPVIVRIAEGRLMLDLRTVDPSDDALLVSALA